MKDVKKEHLRNSILLVKACLIEEPASRNQLSTLGAEDRSDRHACIYRIHPCITGTHNPRECAKKRTAIQGNRGKTYATKYWPKIEPC